MSDTNESVLTVIEAQDQTSEERTSEERPRGGRLRTLARLSLGATLLAVEALSTQLQQVEQEPPQTATEERPIESVLIPADEWETTLKHESESPSRQVLLGLALDTQSRLSSAARAIFRQGDRMVGRVDRTLNPVLNSRALSPIRGPFESLVERGQAQVDYWRELGRAEETRSRVLAEDAAEQLIDTSVDTVSSDPHVQKIVQVIIQQQSMGMVDEAIEEVRERTFTGDMLLERPVRSILRRPPRESLPAPTELIKNLPRVKRERPRAMMKQNMNMYGYYAGFVSRLFAFVVDVLILVLAMTLITWLVAVVNSIVRVDAVLGNLIGAGGIDVASVVLATLLAIGVYVGYPVFFWTLTGQTPGMTLMGLRVVTTEGHYLSLGRAIRRLLGYVVSALVLYLGFLWILVDDRRQGWHDKIAGTCVVYTWHARPDETFFRKLLES